MHIHGASSLQYAALVSTQGAQQAQAARRAAADVRRKLTSFAASGGEDAVAHVGAYAQDGRGRKQKQPQGEEAFRNVFISFNA
jgi:hypothetical protein